ncbi:beta-galactosidase [Wenyingzhuangia sp. 1_MG-2023]|nr:beta-galactosidase [Wenyingzhuangia sp. 1_MG-2023]
MIYKQLGKYLLLFVLMLTQSGFSQTLEQKARVKIDSLNTLIAEVESLGKDALKEKLAVRTAEIFLKFANWDEKNIAENKSHFEKYWLYKNVATQMAEELPDFERNDILALLDESIAYIKKIKKGEVFRAPIPKVDWSKVTVKKDEIIRENNEPVFLADYTWKPDTPELTEFYGELNGFYISPNYVTNASGKINQNVINNLNTKESGTPGFVFINNKNVPQWAIDNYGEDFTKFQGAPFLDYDIDHPGAKVMVSHLLKGTVAKMKGKHYTDLGYMLCNEPRWITYKDGAKKVWYTSGVSNYTIDKFKGWLQNKHQNIAQLNALWNSNFSNFEEVAIDIPIDISLMGTPKWYDWVTFNEDRVTDWFTWMKSELRKYDATAKAQLKIMPSFFTENDPATGIDLEALTELSEINGNDVAANYNYMVKGKIIKDEKYAFGWKELYMGYDFLKSVQPNQLIFNSESHLLSTNNARDLYMDPKYPRAVYWAAHTLGLNASQTWYWPRKEDGSLKSGITGAYAGSNNQQPRVTNALHATMMDLNTHSELIMKMQRERKPIRVFYSKAAAANKGNYMEGVFEMYEGLNFEGIPLGFATKNIVSKQNTDLWDVIVVHKTEQVNIEELKTLQNYIDNGGTVISDAISLKKNEYGLPLTGLKQTKGRLILANTVEHAKMEALQILASKNNLPNVTVVETNANGYKGCAWRCVKNEKGNYVLSIVNLGKTDATLDIKIKEAKNGTVCKDLLNGVKVPAKLILKPYDVYLIELTGEKGEDLTSDEESLKKEKLGTLFPNPSKGPFTIDLNEFQTQLIVEVYSMDGCLISENEFNNVKTFEYNKNEDWSKGMYLLKLKTKKAIQNIKYIKA